MRQIKKRILYVYNLIKRYLLCKHKRQMSTAMLDYSICMNCGKFIKSGAK